MAGCLFLPLPARRREEIDIGGGKEADCFEELFSCGFS